VDGSNEDALAAEAVEDDVRSATDDELAEIGFTSRVAESRMDAKRFDEDDDARGEAFGGGRIVEGNASTNFAQACDGERRPNDFRRRLSHGKWRRARIPQGLKPIGLCASWRS